MKALLYKSFRLVCHPMTPIFAFFGVMLLIPSYPYTLAFFYVMLGIFFTFLNGREQKDIYYSALLPIRKRDTVKASVLFVLLVEFTSLLVAVPFAVLSCRINPLGGNAVGLEANTALFAAALVLYAIFNGIFLPAFYQTAYKVGISFLKAIIPVSLVMIGCEASVHFPGMAWLEDSTPAGQLRLLPLLIAATLIYGAGMYFAYQKAAKNYEKVDI